MNLEFWIRLVLIFFGCFFLMLSAAGALLEMAKKYRLRKAEGGGNPLEPITKLLDSLAALVKQLAAAPLWLALAFVGVALIVLAVYLPINI